tara:strand:- start:11 stop:253 length:243 start_codon:yes stop_codon:yes gene_type:complete
MKYIVFMKDDCPFCVDAKALLELKSLQYSCVVFREGQEEVLSEVKNALEWRTVPIIVEKNEGHTRLIGGYTDLVEHLKDE